MQPIYPTMHQVCPASCTRDLLEFLLSLDLTDDQLKMGLQYLGVPDPKPVKIPKPRAAPKLKPAPKPKRMPSLCTIDGCGGPHEALGMCSRHYHQALRRERAALKPPKPITCSVDDCDRPPRSRGMCKMHYKRVRYREKVATSSAKADLITKA